MATATSSKVFAVAYQGGNAYIYHLNDADGNDEIRADEIALVATLTGVAADALVQANFDLVP